MKKMNYIANNMKIKNKLLLIYFIVVTVTVLTIGIYFTERMTSIVIDNSKKDARFNRENIKNRMEEALKVAIMTSDMIYQDERLHEMITKDYGNLGEIVYSYNEYPLLSNFVRYYDDLYNIRIFVDNQNLLDNSNIVKVTEEISEEDWYKKAVKDKGVITWQFKTDSITKEESLSLIRDVNSYTHGHIGVLVISLDTSKLRTFVDEQAYPTTILVDEKVVVSNELRDGSYIFEDYKEVSYFDTQQEEISLEDRYVLLERFKVDKSFNNTFQVRLAVPVDEIKGQANKAVLNSSYIISAAILLSLFLILYFSRIFSQRVHRLNRVMNKVVGGNFEISEVIEGNDEIGELYRNLTVMVKSTKSLIEEVYVQELKSKRLTLKQKEAEFKMLASQINPHFLFNTLETIRMRAYCQGDRELADIVKKLGKLMRRNLEVTNDTVTLEEELGFIKSYLEIQSLRFQGKIEYYFNIEVEPSSYRILPLLLQPLVENAFVHGLEGSLGEGKIEITSFEDIGYLIIEIADNGIGISKEELEFINNQMSNKKNLDKSSIGISNINDRIKLFYGEDYGVYIISTPGIGTKAVVLLPARRKEEEDAEADDNR